MRFAGQATLVGCSIALLLGCSKSPDAGTPAAAPLAAPAAPAAQTAPPVAAAAPASTTAVARAGAGPDAHAEGIAWRHASNDADVDAAFRLARAEAKPVFVYWGAEWCPPCNQVKATIFNRQDFIERSRAFVPVYIDGDSPGAQKLGARFRVAGYPTMLLFSADGIELTRLPGEVDPARYTEVVTLGMNAKRPAKAVLADAPAGGRDLTPNDWRLLAFHSWAVDEQQVVPKSEVPAMLKRLAAACPPGESETATRLWLQALAASDAKAPAAAVASPADVDRLTALLGDAALARRHYDVLANSATDIVRALAPQPSPHRERLLSGFDRLLAGFEDDPALSRADRMGALIARIDLAGIDLPEAKTPPARLAAARSLKLTPALLADVRERTARVDREITDGYERQSVIPAAAYLLARAGLIDESDALLKSNLAKSHSPYYLMTQLADNAAQRGANAEAVKWHREAYAKSTGPATRLQWGARYVTALIDLTPGDAAAIESAATQLIDEAGTQPNAFYERSARSLKRVGAKLGDWNRDGAHAAALRRVEARFGVVCSRIDGADAQRATCDDLFKPGPKKSA